MIRERTQLEHMGKGQTGCVKGLEAMTNERFVSNLPIVLNSCETQLRIMGAKPDDVIA